MNFFLKVFVILLFFSVPIFAQDSDFLEGFDEEIQAEDLSGVESEDEKSSLFTIDGFFKLSSAYNFNHKEPNSGLTNWKGFSKLKSDLQVEMEYKIFYDWKIYVSSKVFYDSIYFFKGRDKYTDETISFYESEIELKEVYVQGKILADLDFKVGRQIVVWGKSDNIRITDILNPLDGREPGLTDIEDLRLPIMMVKLDYFFGDWNLQAITVHEDRYNKTPAFGSDFYMASTPPLKENKPGHGFKKSEFAASLNGRFSGWDLSFYSAYYYNDIPYVKIVSPTNITREYCRTKMAGFAYNKILGNLILKTESVFLSGLKFSSDDNEFNRFDALIGFEYSGLTDSSISVELSDRHILNFNDLLKNSPDFAVQDEVQSAVKISRNFLNEIISLTVLANFFGADLKDGSFERLTLDYKGIDNFTFTVGTLLYQSGDLKKYSSIGANDRFFAEVKYSF